MKVFLQTALILTFASSLLAGNGIIWPADRPIPGEYIVVLADQRTPDVGEAAAALARAHSGSIIVTLTHGVKAFGIRIPHRANAEALSRSPLVDHVEENGEVQTLDVPAQASLLRRLVPMVNAASAHHPLRPVPLANHCPWTGYFYQCTFSDSSFWHLDRIDQTYCCDDWSYGAANTGWNVNVYLLGTGVLATHEQFEGNVLTGVTFGDGLPANNPCGGFPLNPDPSAPDYGPGHDTAVASVVAGKTNGVAKDATIIPVKTINCDPSTGMITGGSILWDCWALDWILANAATSGKPSILSTSHFWFVASVQDQQCATSSDPGSPTTPCLPAFENNVRQAVINGITVVASANNQNGDACATTPARMAYGNVAYDYHVISVGGSNEQDQLWVRAPNEMIPGCNPPSCVDTGSNFGVCVDIYAPAHNLLHLANISSNTAYRTRIDQLSGTSWAAPVVAGIAARILQGNSTWTPLQVWTNIHDTAAQPGCFDTSNPCNKLRIYRSPYN